MMTTATSPAQGIEEQQMAEPQQRPDEGSRSAPAAKKAPAKKAPAKKAPAKKAAAEKAPAKKAPAKKAPAKKAPAKKTPPPQPAPKATTNGAREAAATAKSSVQDAVVSPQDSFGRGHRIPLSLGLAAAGLVAIVVSRLRRG